VREVIDKTRLTELILASGLTASISGVNPADVIRLIVHLRGSGGGEG